MKTFIVDANLLLLWVVGRASREYIKDRVHKKLDAYSLEDFDLLSEILSKAPRVILTPNTLTEVSNHADWVKEPAKSEISAVLRCLAQASDGVEEHIVASATATNRREFSRLGLTDSVLLELASGAWEILTADNHLYLAAAHAGYPATNFNHLRAF